MRSRPAAYVLPALRGSSAQQIRRTLEECAGYTMLEVQLSTGRNVKELTESCPWDLEPNEGPDQHDDEVPERKVSAATVDKACTKYQHMFASVVVHHAAFQLSDALIYCAGRAGSDHQSTQHHRPGRSSGAAVLDLGYHVTRGHCRRKLVSIAHLQQCQP